MLAHDLDPYGRWRCRSPFGIWKVYRLPNLIFYPTQKKGSNKPSACKFYNPDRGQIWKGTAWHQHCCPCLISDIKHTEAKLCICWNLSLKRDKITYASLKKKKNSRRLNESFKTIQLNLDYPDSSGPQ